MKQRSNPLDWIHVEDGQIVLEVDQFPDGSFRFRGEFSELDNAYPVAVTLKSTLPEAIVALHQVVDALQDYFNGNVRIEVFIQTFPDQRADRVEKDGQSVPAKTSARLIAALDVEDITVFDPHSQMFVQELQALSTADIHVITAAQCFEWTLWENLLEDVKIDYVVAVDKGAVRRAQEVAVQYGATVIYADKKRIEGKVVGHVLDGTPDWPIPAGSNIWIIDDLCDGGATFISIANLLNASFAGCNLNLYVTHGLFSKGKEELSNYYNTIITRFDYAKIP